MPKYTQDDWDQFQGLLGTGHSPAEALRELGIPKGSLGTLNRRFNGSTPEVEVEAEVIGALGQQLHEFTTQLWDLANSMSELAKHASGLALFDRTLGQLQATQHEAVGLRKRLAEVENRLLARASVVHSTD